MQKKDNSKPSTDKNERKRGRPAGKNRVPLSLEERRARNAQYERERRNETADAMAQLAEAACCDPQISNPELLATVINRLQNSQSESLEDLKRINDDLESQIAALQSRLDSDPYALEKDLKNHDTRTEPQSESNSEDTESIEDQKPTKYRKTSKRCKVHDGVRQSSRSSSHPESSTDTQGSDWSNHHLGKSLPSQEALEQSRVQPTTPMPSSSNISRTESMLLELNQTNSRLKFERAEEFYSECSIGSGEFCDTLSQQDVKADFQLLPELNLEDATSREEHEQMMDPFTDREKAILTTLGWCDFIDLQNVYSESQAKWPVNYADY